MCIVALTESDNFFWDFIMELSFEKLGFVLDSKEYEHGVYFKKAHMAVLPVLLQNKDLLKVGFIEHKDGLLLTDVGTLDQLAAFLGLSGSEFNQWRQKQAKDLFCEFKEVKGFSNLHLVYRPVNDNLISAFSYFMSVIFQFMIWMQLKLLVAEFGKKHGCSVNDIEEMLKKVMPKKEEEPSSGSVN